MVGMLEEARSHLAAMRRFFEDLDPRTVSPDDARLLLREACAIEHFGASIKYRFTPRAMCGAPWQEEGHRSEASWLAEATRTSVPEAVAPITTAQRLAELPTTAEALMSGAISPTEAKAVAAAASADPTTEAELLASVGTMTVSTLCSAARHMANAAHERDPEHRQKVHSNRFLRFWRDDEGMCRFSGGVTPDAGLEILSAVRSRAAHVADEARRAQLPEESQAAYDADALVALAIGDERRATFHGPEGGQSRRSQVVYHVSLGALQRGSLEDGEICEVPGVGPVPLKVVEDVVGDATARLLIRDGVDVRSVCHLGRTVPAHLETALEGRDRTCVVPGCTVALGLEIDHWQIPYSKGGPTELWNLARICKFHHRLKTYEGYDLSGGPGKWEWRPPN
jgi:hypothetical protein